MVNLGFVYCLEDVQFLKGISELSVREVATVMWIKVCVKFCVTTLSISMMRDQVTLGLI